jgi:hypothetical protein
MEGTMARTFQNPFNGHREKVFGDSWVGALLFGPFYLAAKGLWRHFFIWVLILSAVRALTGMAGIIIALPILSIIYALSIQGILTNSYLRKGWVEVAEGAVKPMISSADSERHCPFCAETIKRAAVKCKHCGSDLEAAEPVPEQQAGNSGWTIVLPCKPGPDYDEACSLLAATGYPLLREEPGKIIIGPYSDRGVATSAKKKIAFKYALHGELLWSAPS